MKILAISDEVSPIVYSENFPKNLPPFDLVLWPLLITNDDDFRTVQIGLRTLASSNITEFNLVFAGTVVASIPIFVLLIVFQKQLVRGLTSGAVKG